MWPCDQKALQMFYQAPAQMSQGTTGGCMKYSCPGSLYHRLRADSMAACLSLWPISLPSLWQVCLATGQACWHALISSALPSTERTQIWHAAVLPGLVCDGTKRGCSGTLSPPSSVTRPLNHCHQSACAACKPPSKPEPKAAKPFKRSSIGRASTGHHGQKAKVSLVRQLLLFS